MRINTYYDIYVGAHFLHDRAQAVGPNVGQNHHTSAVNNYMHAYTYVGNQYNYTKYFPPIL